MNTLNTYTCTDSWGLVYDSASSGDFIGTIQEITGYRSFCYIGSGIPGNDDAGFVLSGGFLQISVNAANKLYAKRYPGDPYSMPKLSLAMANITVVGGAAPVGSAPTANPVGISGIDGSGLKRAVKVNADGGTVVAASPMLYTEDWNAALTATYQKVATTTTATKSLRMSCACNATAYDIEYAVVTAGAAAPTANGQALLAGDDFLAGIPVGDIYARSATAQKLIVWRA